MTPFEILHQALDAEIGIRVRTDNVNKLRLKIYSERQRQQKAGNFDFDDISILEMPEDELWLVKREVLRRWRDEREQESIEI